MDNHDIAHYTIAALIAGGLGVTGSQLYKTAADVQSIYHVAEADLGLVPFGQHKYIIATPSGSGTLPSELKRAIGNNSTIELSLPFNGIWVTPDTDEGHAVANAISALVHEPVEVKNLPSIYNIHGTPYEIGVGLPLEK